MRSSEPYGNRRPLESRVVGRREYRPCRGGRTWNECAARRPGPSEPRHCPLFTLQSAPHTSARPRCPRLPPVAANPRRDNATGSHLEDTTREGNALIGASQGVSRPGTESPGANCVQSRRGGIANRQGLAECKRVTFCGEDASEKRRHPCTAGRGWRARGRQQPDRRNGRHRRSTTASGH